jgi:intracellular multiplication protein IcmL
MTTAPPPRPSRPPAPKPTPPAGPAGLGAVQLRNDWYRDRYPMLVRTIFVQSIALLVVGLLAGWLVWDRPEPKYFVADPTTGAVLEVVPVDRPLLTNAALAQWASETARLAYSVDFVHYDRQLSALRDRFAPEAYSAFLTEFDNTNLQAIKSRKLVFAASSEPGVITQAGIASNGHFRWLVEVPVTLVAHYGGDSSRVQRLRIVLEVMRVDNRLRPESGVVVTKFLTHLG